MDKNQMKIEGKTSQKVKRKVFVLMKKRIPIKFGFLVCWFIRKKLHQKINFSTTHFHF